MHVRIANPRWRGKRSRHSRRIPNPQFKYLARDPCMNVLWSVFFWFSCVCFCVSYKAVVVLFQYSCITVHLLDVHMLLNRVALDNSKWVAWHIMALHKLSLLSANIADTDENQKRISKTDIFIERKWATHRLWSSKLLLADVPVIWKILQILSRKWLGTCLVPSHYLNQWWLIVNGILGTYFSEVWITVWQFSNYW